MPEPDPPSSKPFVRDYSSFWTPPPRARASLSPVALILLAVVVAILILALITPLIRLARDSAVALFA